MCVRVWLCFPLAWRFSLFLIECVLLGLTLSELNLFNLECFFSCLRYRLCFSQSSTSWCAGAILWSEEFNNQCYFEQLCKMYMLWLLICGAFPHQEQNVNLHHSGTLQDDWKPYTPLTSIERGKHPPVFLYILHNIHVRHKLHFLY